MDVVHALVVVGAWAPVAHKIARHPGELTNLGGHGAAEAVVAHKLRWGGERAKHESVQWRVLIIERDDERERAALRRVS